MRKGISAFFLFLCLFIIFSTVSMASPNDENMIIDDTFGYFTDEETEYIKTEAKQLPETYKYFILPSIDGDTEIKQMAESLFEIKKFSQDTIFILVVTDERKIYITTGEALQKKDLNATFFNNEIVKYFVPTVIEKKSIAQGLVELSKGISKDIPLYLETNKSSLAIPEQLEESQVNDESNSTSYTQIIMIIGVFIVLILTLWVIVKVYFNKRK